MIPSFVVRRFLARELRDFRRWKKFSEHKLDRLKESLPAKPPIWNKLRIEQKVCFIIGAREKRFLFFLDTGVGKTLLSIALARYFKRAGVGKRFLVLVPNTVNCDEWELQVDEHSPKTKIVSLVGSSDDKWHLFENEEALLYVTTYAGLMHMVSKMKVVKRKSGEVSKLTPNTSLKKRVARRIDGIFLDESTIAQNKHALPFRIVRSIAKGKEVVVLLTGTPFGRDPTPLWAQFFLVDGGETLGKTLGLFRAAFFNEKKNYWGGSIYTFMQSRKRKLRRFLANRSIRYRAEQSTLPKLVPLQAAVKLPVDAVDYAKRAERAIVEAHGNYAETKNAFLRMRQISSGFLGYKDDETGERAKYVFPENPKLDLLMAKLEAIDPIYKVVIFHEFIFSGQQISKRLTDAKIGHVSISGKVKKTKPLLRRFKSDPSCRVLVLNSAKGAYGLNLQVARYLMFYEAPVRNIIRKQAQRRVERQYSSHKRVIQYDFITEGTYDRRILRFLDEGERLFAHVIDDE